MNIKLFFKKTARGALHLKYLLIPVLLLTGIIFGWLFYQSSINMKWEKATDYYRRADYDAAANELKGLPIPSKDVDRLAIYSQTMLATRQLDNARDGYKQLYELKKDPFTKVVLGNIYNEQKRYDEATKIYKEVTVANPNYAQAYVNLATLHKLQGDNTKAVQVASDAVKNNPNNTVLLELLVSLTMTDKESPVFQEAVAKLKKVNPNDPLLELIE